MAKYEFTVTAAPTYLAERAQAELVGAHAAIGQQARQFAHLRLFRAFQVSEVPAYVVTASDFDLCSGFDCTSAVPPYDRMNGNVTAEYALRTIAEGGGPGARIAAQHLARLQGDQP